MAFRSLDGTQWMRDSGFQTLISRLRIAFSQSVDDFLAFPWSFKLNDSTVCGKLSCWLTSLGLYLRFGCWMISPTLENPHWAHRIHSYCTDRSTHLARLLSRWRIQKSSISFLIFQLLKWLEVSLFKRDGPLMSWCFSIRHWFQFQLSWWSTLIKYTSILAQYH